MNKRLILPFISIIVIITGTFIAIQFAKGYRPNFKTGNLQGTGLLVANSFPDGAQVFLNGKLTTATDDTLNLAPGQYQVEIKKDGFTPWQKTLQLKSELVTQTNATLFSSVPTLKPLTFTGAINPTPSPDGQKIAYLVAASSNLAKNGLWVINLSGTNLLRAQEPSQVSRLQITDPNNIHLTWSPDSRQLLLSTNASNYLLDINRFNDLDTTNDVTARLPIIFADWENSLLKLEIKRLLSLPPAMQKIATQSATNLYFSPNEEKLFYTATQETTIPPDLAPDLPSESTQTEDRHLIPGKSYAYDIKEDKNFLISEPKPAELGLNPPQKITLTDDITKQPLFSLDSSPSASLKLQTNFTTKEIIANFNSQYSPLPIISIQWFPTSSHLITFKPDHISIIEYDGTNSATIFANSYNQSFVYPWPDGSRLILLTNLNQNSSLPSNLYSIDLK